MMTQYAKGILADQRKESKRGSKQLCLVSRTQLHTHYLCLQDIQDAKLEYHQMMICIYQSGARRGILWVRYLSGDWPLAVRILRTVALHFPFAPVWALIRSSTMSNEPLDLYWKNQLDRCELHPAD